MSKLFVSFLFIALLFVSSSFQDDNFNPFNPAPGVASVGQSLAYQTDGSALYTINFVTGRRLDQTQLTFIVDPSVTVSSVTAVSSGITVINTTTIVIPSMILTGTTFVITVAVQATPSFNLPTTLIFNTQSSQVLADSPLNTQVFTFTPSSSGAPTDSPSTAAPPAISKVNQGFKTADSSSYTYTLSFVPTVDLTQAVATFSFPSSQVTSVTSSTPNVAASLDASGVITVTVTQVLTANTQFSIQLNVVASQIQFPTTISFVSTTSTSASVSQSFNFSPSSGPSLPPATVPLGFCNYGSSWAPTALNSLTYTLDLKTEEALDSFSISFVSSGVVAVSSVGQAKSTLGADGQTVTISYPSPTAAKTQVRVQTKLTTDVTTFQSPSTLSVTFFVKDQSYTKTINFQK